VQALSFDPEIHCVDRFALLVTLMLTASTYSLVIGGELPTLGYLTLIDKYVLGTFLFIFLVTIEVASAEFAKPDACDFEDDDYGDGIGDMDAGVNSEDLLHGIYKNMGSVTLTL
jgi:hypothetical protein